MKVTATSKTRQFSCDFVDVDLTVDGEPYSLRFFDESTDLELRKGDNTKPRNHKTIIDTALPLLGMASLVGLYKSV